MSVKQLGELFLFPNEDRPQESNITLTTSWQLIDFSADVPAGVTALQISVDSSNNDGRTIICVTDDDDDSVTAQTTYMGSILEQQATIVGLNRSVRHLTILAPGGKFYIAEYNSTTWDTVDNSQFIVVTGYYMPVAQPQPLLPGGINVTWTKLTTNNANNWDCNIYYGKDGDTVYLSGQAQCANVNGAGGDSYPIATLPSGFRPPQNILVSANSGANSMIDPQLPIQARVWYTGNLYPGAVIPHSHCIYFNTSFICA